MQALITNIQGYSIHDGPGIRTVVFLKGCPLKCKWCANPENLTASVQVGFLKGLCSNCGGCTSKCPEGAIIPGEGVYRIDRKKCTECGECLDACFSGALVKYGSLMTSKETFDKVKRDKMFYDSSGGGVTVSGGEPLLYPEFVYELFSECAGAGINTCAETCGFVTTDAIMRVLPVTDWLYYDLKHMDPSVHREYTGQDNGLILDNARLAVAEGANVLFRLPLIPGINDTDGNITATAEFIKSLKPGGQAGAVSRGAAASSVSRGAAASSVSRGGPESSANPGAAGDTECREMPGIQIMPYHRAGQTKYDALQMDYGTAGIGIMPAPAIEAIKQKFIDSGVNCSISK